MPERIDEMEQRRALLETLFHNAPVGFACVDDSFRFVRVNEAFAAISGLSASEEIGKRVQDVVPGLWPDVEPLYRRALAGETILNHDVSGVASMHGGPVRHWLVSYYPVRMEGEIIGLGIIANDITERRLAERALAVRNDLYAMLSRTSRVVSQCRSANELFQEVCTIAVETGRFRFAWVGVPEGNEVKLVAAAGEDGGYMREITIVLDDDNPLSKGPTGMAAKTGQSFVVNDFSASPITAPWREAARRAGFAASAAFPLRERGRVAAVLMLYAAEPGFFTDDLVTTLSEITPSISFALDGLVQERERRRDEEELRLRDRAIGAVSQGIVITDPSRPDNPIIYASPGFERLTGYSPGEAIGRNCRFLQGRDSDPAAVELIRSAVSAGRGCTVELLNYRKDGTPFWNSLTIAPVMDAGGRVTHFVGVQADVTERRRLEDQFRQAQKMEAIGQLAGGVAHDFNNLLTVINSYSTLLLEDAGADSPTREMLIEIRKAGDRAGALTRQLLAFSRKQMLEPKVLNLNSIVSDTEKMLRRLIGEDIVLTLRLSPELGLVKADPGQVSQILINLAVNARDAMATNGRLTIATGNVVLDAAYCHDFPDLAPGEYVLLTVQDTGVGMDAATIARAFEPFFTTKGIGKGTGLGLATVHGIVKQSRGHVAIDSEPGHGATFRVYLPRVSDARAEPGVPAVLQPMPPGLETVLLVEDEAAVRVLAQRILYRCGYEVLEAANGEEALRLSELHPGPIHLLISDVVMPYLGGGELAQRILERRPECKVLFLSGYMDDAVIRHGVQSAEYAFLQKPFTPSSLAQKVESVLRDGT